MCYRNLNRISVESLLLKSRVDPIAAVAWAPISVLSLLRWRAVKIGIGSFMTSCNEGKKISILQNHVSQRCFCGSQFVEDKLLTTKTYSKFQIKGKFKEEK